MGLNLFFIFRISIGNEQTYIENNSVTAIKIIQTGHNSAGWRVFARIVLTIKIVST